LKTSVQYAGEYSQYDAGENSQLDIPIILKAKNFDLPGANEDEYYNEFHTVMKENRYEKAFEFMQDTSEESLNLGSPFAVAGGVNFLASVGNSGAVSLYMHYNYYFSNINWAAAYNENDIEEFLIAGNKKLSGSEDFNIETNNFKSTISSSSSFISQGLEAGLSYYVKIK